MKHIISIFVAVCSFFFSVSHAQKSQAPNAVLTVIYTDSNQTGPAVFGVFEGKTPCQEITKEMNMEVSPGCIKLKWRLTLYQDPVTHEPSTYKLDGSYFREKNRLGIWNIETGMGTDPLAKIYRLDLGETNGYLYLLKGDDHVLFFLDRNKNYLVGNPQFSYTLNRVQKEEIIKQ